MNDIGSIIQLHKHSNFNVLELLSDIKGKLYYNGKPVEREVSKKINNAIQILTDGLYVDGTYFLTKEQYDFLTDFLTRFSYHDNNLYFDDELLALASQTMNVYTEEELRAMVISLWIEFNEMYPEFALPIKPFANFITADNTVILSEDKLLLFAKTKKINEEGDTNG